MRRRARVVAVAAVFAVAASGCAWTVRAVDDVNGGDPNADVSDPALSDDGRWLAFSSAASDLVAGDTNGVIDVFLHDELTGQTTLVSKKNDGSLNDADSELHGISGDGRHVLFSTASTSITTPSAANELYRYDRQADAIEVVPGTTPGPAVLSGDGNTVAVDTEPQVFQNTQDEVVNMTTGAVSEPSELWNSVSLSHDGRFLGHTITNWNDPYLATRSFVRDLDTGADVDLGKGVGPQLSDDGAYAAFIELVALSPSTDEPRVSIRRVDDPNSLETIVADAWDARAIDISGDARFVSFTDTESLLGGDTDGLRDLYIWDRESATMRLASRSGLGTIVNADIDDHALSGDGRTVAFGTTATNLGGAVAGTSQLYLRIHPRPVLQAVSPLTVLAGTGITLTLTGVGFMDTPVVRVDGGEVTVDSVSWVDDSTVTADITVSGGAAPGPRDVTLINVGTGPGPTATAPSTCAGCLTITL